MKSYAFGTTTLSVLNSGTTLGAGVSSLASLTVTHVVVTFNVSIERYRDIKVGDGELVVTACDLWWASCSRST
jgi:hypothetical protein